MWCSDIHFFAGLTSILTMCWEITHLPLSILLTPWRWVLPGYFRMWKINFDSVLPLASPLSDPFAYNLAGPSLEPSSNSSAILSPGPHSHKSCPNPTGWKPLSKTCHIIFKWGLDGVLWGRKGSSMARQIWRDPLRQIRIILFILQLDTILYTQ